MKLSEKTKELQSILDKVDIDDFYTFSVSTYYISFQGWVKDEILRKYSDIFGGEFEKEVIDEQVIFSLDMDGVRIVFSC